MRLAFLLAVGATACSTYGAEADVRPPERDAGTEAGPTGIAPVHVAPFGRDFAEGTESAPVATLKRALAIAAERPGADVLVCEGTYGDPVMIDRSVRVFGNRSCDGWKESTTRARIAPLDGVALTITTTSNVLVEGFEVVGNADHTTPGASAVAVFVVRSTGVVLRNVNVTARGGIDGADAAVATPNWTGTPPVSNGAIGAIHVCADGTASTGGNGGSASGALATSGSALPPSGTPNAGASGSTCTNGSGGSDGSSPPAGDALSVPFEVTLAGLVAKHGARGESGKPAQGGGGGGATTTSGGGGGGAGGCGGAGGAGGTSGGSSIALLAFDADVVAEASSLTAGDGANGGNGASGQSGQGGAGGGAGACSGGGGGRGGDAAGGGGGGGGFSAAVVHVGARPNLATTTTTSIGAPGRGGAGGAGGASLLDGKAGAPGKADGVITL